METKPFQLNLFKFSTFFYLTIGNLYDIMEITVLMENNKLKGSDFKTENGLSLLIENKNGLILFDPGGPKNYAIQNAQKLGVDLSKVDAVVISHGHNDHTGGLLNFFKLNDKAPVYLKKEALNPYYAKLPDKTKYIGIDDKIVENHSNRLIFVDKNLEISPGMFLIPDIERKFPIPSNNQILFEGKEDKMIKDEFKHELFMVLEKNNNLTVFSGCGHSGITNIINKVKNTFPKGKINTVLGGFHFQSGSETSIVAEKEEIEGISHWLADEGIENVYTGHCTGERGMEIMSPILEDKLHRICTGMKITLDIN